MGNKNSMERARLNRKQAKTGKNKPTNTRFGTDGNLNKSRKNYAAVFKKSQTGGTGI